MNEIDKIIKDKLQGLEAPYNPKAWDAVASRLDTTMPIKSNTSKWIWSAATTVAVLGIAGLIYLNTTGTTDQQEVSVALQETQENTVKESTSATTPSINPTVTAGVEQDQKAVKIVEKGKIVTVSSPSQVVDSKTHTFSSVSPNPPYFVMEDRTASSQKMILPALKSTYCLNESVEFQNKNNFDVRILSSAGTTTVLAGKKATLQLNASGDYYIANATSKEQLFQVVAFDGLQFNHDKEMLFDKGLPFFTVSTDVDAVAYTWYDDNDAVLGAGKSLNINLFTKGTHNVTLKVEDAKGCEAKVTKPIYVEAEYNLLAVTGFNPLSTIESNRTFLPFALLKTERNVPFKMEIIDPKSGQVIFETQSADQPWDGMNAKTNEMVAPHSTYIWKVYLYEKAKGEKKNIYQGTITRI